MAKTGERRSEVGEDACEDLKRLVKVGPAGVLSTLLIFILLIAVFVLGIALLFR